MASVIEHSKACTKCGEWKTLSEFHLRADRGDTQKRQAHCKLCSLEDGRESYKRNAKRIAELRKARYNSDPVYKGKQNANSRMGNIKYKDARSANRRAYKASNREKISRRGRELHLKNTYGITVAKYESMLAEQGNCCAVCHSSDPHGVRFCVDHCHSTGKIRGILCHKCNLAIGLLGDDLKSVIQAVNYLVKFSNNQETE